MAGLEGFGHPGAEKDSTISPWCSVEARTPVRGWSGGSLVLRKLQQDSPMDRRDVRKSDESSEPHSRLPAGLL